tara:strand:+ start:179550 stop:180419 length:870 start_codon:yes stop_codon:yes gene_type:complete
MKWLLIALMSSSFLWAQDNGKSELEKEAEVIDYSNIKSVLKEDGLENEAKLKKKIIKKIKEEKKEIQLSKYNYPNKDSFWSFMSEFWLVKNAQELKWDAPRPDYGVNIAFKNLLEKLGYYNKSYKILIVDSPNITHLGLPSNPNEFILILSLPFMRTLDLTKVDISLLLLENFLRVEKGFFQENLLIKPDFIGSNFYKEGMNKKKINELLNEYSNVAYKKGFNFQQQYEVTKAMDRLLKSYPELWSVYFRLLGKIDSLIKSNLLYKNYTKIYPSPEMQIQWLKPKEEVL